MFGSLSAFSAQNEYRMKSTKCEILNKSLFLSAVAERPQHMLMRVAVGIHQTDIDAAIETYNLLSERWFTHASPTLFNAGTNKPQLSRSDLSRVHRTHTISPSVSSNWSHFAVASC